MHRPPLPRALVVTAAVLASAALAAGQQPAAKAEPDSALEKLLAAKPFPVGSDDTPLVTLQKERFNTRLEVAKIQARAYRAGALSPQDFNGLLAVLASNGADVEAKPADKLRWLELRVGVLRGQEELAQKQAKAGPLNAADYLQAKAARLDAEIDLFKMKESARAGKDPARGDK
jgi:hypothetical protein